MNPNNLICAKGPLPQLLPRPSQRAISHDVQERHPPEGAMGEALWIPLQI